MTQHDYKNAYETIHRHVQIDGFESIFLVPINTVLTALLIADRLMQEPTYGMVGSYIMSLPDGVATCDPIIRNGFKAMRDQMLKELENG